MRLVPTFDDLADAQNAINAQHPSLADDPPATTLANETDGNGRRVLRVTTQQLATLVHGLALATVRGLDDADFVLAALASIRLVRRADGTVRTADPGEAVPQVARLFALELARREGSLGAAAAAATCEACKRERCDCYARTCDKCHSPGSPNCRRKAASTGER